MTENSDENTTIHRLKEEISKFSQERDWNKYHTPKDLAISICIEAAELLENFQWLTVEEIEKDLKKPKRRQRIASEVADVINYTFALANILDIDISEAVMEKIRENKLKYPIDKTKGNYRKYSEIK